MRRYDNLHCVFFSFDNALQLSRCVSLWISSNTASWRAMTITSDPVCKCRASLAMYSRAPPA